LLCCWLSKTAGVAGFAACRLCLEHAAACRQAVIVYLVARQGSLLHGCL
jgi:hypothetical protein